ncbi:kynurenine formamidase [Colletotrichum musicola]|uniref:Kynurenine formamidase n=1 Tax=Colletotrichum musicola TaxID=2175873 RepID=A0A8H6K7T5_9PEZI|nr:kynurenine formamidase [Colletotrichum musicola]
MASNLAGNTKWELTNVESPHIDHPVPTVAALNVPYVQDGHRFQTLNIYLPRREETSKLIGKPVTSIPGSSPAHGLPKWQVHIHGGAWRDPNLTARSIEPAVAHAFSDPSKSIDAVISINYTLSPFPSHPSLPHDPAKGSTPDPAREGRHPDHVRDVLRAFAFLRTLGLRDDYYILTGHSAGACLAFQSILNHPSAWGIKDLEDPPRPAALLGMNGLYDLPDLVDGLGASHASLAEVYRDLQGRAFGADRGRWEAASPARVPLDGLSERMSRGRIPRLIIIDQSDEDQLIPMNQADKLEAHLRGAEGLRAVRGSRCSGRHAAPWEEGIMIWDGVRDILEQLA